MATLLNVGLINAAFVTLLAVLVYLFTRVWRRPALAHGLWLLVLAKLVAPPFFSVPLPTWLAVFATHTEVRAEGAPVTQIAPLPQEPVPNLDALAKAEDATPIDPEASSPVGDSALIAIPDSALTQEVVPAFPAWYADAHDLAVAYWQEIIAGFWLAGSIGWLGLAFTRVMRFHRALHDAELAPRITQRQTAVLAEELGLRRSPAVYFVPGHLSPMLWALTGSTRLLLPKALWSQLTWEQQRTLLVHELAHVRRRDHWVRLVEVIVTALYWWHPVTWLAKHELREAEEACCDAWVTTTLPTAHKSYATALLATVDFLAGVRRPLPLAASGVGHVRHLQRRLTMIIRGTTPRSLSWYGCLGLLGLGMTILPVLPTWAQQPPPPRPPDQPGFGGQAQPDRPPEASRREAITGRVASDPNARDHLEKLEAMLQVKKAEIRRAEVAVRGAEEAMGTVNAAGNAVSARERSATNLQMQAAQADLEIKRAEARVVEVEIAQARRNLEQGGRNPGERARGERATEPRDRATPPPAAPQPGAVPPTPPVGPMAPRPGGGGAGGFFPGTPGTPAPPGYPSGPGVGPGPGGGAGPGQPGAPGAGGALPPGAPATGGPAGGAPGGFGGAFRSGGGGGFSGTTGGFGGGSSFGNNPFGGRDIERRLDEMEKKLNRLLEEMERMRGDQPGLRRRDGGDGRQPTPAGGGGGRGDGAGSGGGRAVPPVPTPPSDNSPRRPGGGDGGDPPTIRG